MNAGGNPWDNEYRCRGRLWGGDTGPLPSIPHSSRILELGCGNGKTAAALVQQGYCVTALDFSPRAAALCRHACRSRDTIRVLVADATQVPCKTGSFDVIVAVHITGHLRNEERLRFAGEVERLLSPGGRFYFRDFSTADFRYGKGVESEERTFTRKNGISTHYFTCAEVETLFPSLCPRSVTEHRWNLRFRGVSFPRAEIIAEFDRDP